jgi:hypothetical protein
VGAADLDDLVPGLRLPHNDGGASSKRGQQPLVHRTRRAMCMAVGKLSLDDWPLLTWSLGWTGLLPPRLPVRISLAPAGDHLVGVHVRLRAGARLPDHEGELVVQRAGGDFGRSLLDRLGMLRIEPADARIHPSAAACFTKPSACTISAGIASRWPNGKLSIERCVCAPQYASPGTSDGGPKLSVSERVVVMLFMPVLRHAGLDPATT